jgi:hypothetical protein
MFRKLTGRFPSDKESTLLQQLHTTEWKKFNQSPEKMKGWIKTGIFKASHDDLALLAANAVVASTIMNSDASITKR